MATSHAVPVGQAYGKRREKVKTTLKEYIDELQREQPPDENAPRDKSVVATPRFARTLLKQHLQPLIDLVYSDSTDVQRDATGLLGTLALNADNIDILIESGSLKPLLTMAGSTDPAVRRSALCGLAYMTSREDIRARLCAVAGGLKQVVAGIECADVPSRLAAAECIANVAGSHKLRGQVVDPKVGGLPALLTLLVSRVPELKRWGMVALQRLAACKKAHGASVQTKDDPQGDGYADEMLEAGVLVPLLTLLRGGQHVDEDLRTLAMTTVFFLADANDHVKKRLGEQPMLMKTVVDLLLLDEYPGGPTQREACRTVQLLSIKDDNLYAMIRAGLIVALSMLARSDHLLKKQFAATMMMRIASEPGCRQSLLEAGGARTLCFLCRSSLPRKVVRPAANAITQMSADEHSVSPLLDAGAATVLATLAASSDPELRAEASRALADMICCHTERDGASFSPPKRAADSKLITRITDQLLQQGALAVFFAAVTGADRTWTAQRMETCLRPEGARWRPDCVLRRPDGGVAEL